MSADNVTDHQRQLLTLVADRELNGRELARAFEQSAGRDIPFGTLYRTMDGMVAAGLVTSREAHEGRRTRYYGITAQGRQALHRQAD